MTIVALVAAGDMGAALGRVLADHGATVITLLEGRSPATRVRAERAGMVGKSAAELAEADIVLSVLPSSQVIDFASYMAPYLKASKRRPAFIDCNPVTPEVLKEIESIVTGAGVPFIDGSIIGLKPNANNPGPAIYVSGPAAAQAEILTPLGLRIRRLDASIGAATALKLSYASITKGLFGIASSAILAAERHGVATAFYAELAASQSPMMASLARGIPDMFDKCGRWVAEMEAVSAYLGQDRAESGIYTALARFNARIAADFEGKQEETGVLGAFFATEGQGKP